MDNTNAWSWSEFCGTKADNFTVWSDDDFNHCFELLVLVSGTNFLLAIVSIYHLAKYTQLEQMIHSNVVHPGVITFRLIVTIALVLAPVMEIVLSYLVYKINMSLVGLITSGVLILTWLFHIGYLWKLRRVYIHRIALRGPTPILVSYALVLAAVVIELQSNIREVLYIDNPTYTAENYVRFVEAGLHFFYLLSLVPSNHPIHGLYGAGGLQVQFPGDSEESQLLLRSQRSLRYGSITPRDDFGDGYDGANIFSRLTFSWVRPLLRKGAAEMVHSANDLYRLPKDLRTRTIQIAFHKALSNEPQNPVQDENTSSSGDGLHVRFVDNDSSTSSQGKTTLLRAMNRAFGLEYYSIGILKLVADLSAFAGPVLLNLLVSYIENKNEPSVHGYLYACGLFLSTLIAAIANNQFGYLCNLVGLKIRASIITTVYHKTVSVSMVSLGKFTTGEIVNFMSTDTDRIVNFAPSFHQFWSLPFQVAISLYLLYRQIGLAFLAGLGFAVLLIPINRWIAVKIGSLSKVMMEQKDGRVKVVNEVLNGIRVIKFYALEETFIERINRIRIAELSSLKGRKYLDALCVYFWATTPVFISILSFTTYALMGNTLTAAKVFTSLALFNILIMPLNAFPWVINGLMEAWVSLKRLEKFMKLDELDLAAYYSKAPTIDDSSMIRIKHGAFSWHRQDSQEEESSPSETAGNETLSSEFRTQKLEDVNISVKKGQLVGIVGKVGSGKSSLLSAILAEMTHEGGSIEVTCLDEGFGYTSQEAWIQHATIRENIIGGAHFDVTRYQAVIESCALIEDLKILPAGDQTEVGENGVTLSGGQKARVGLARAVYQDKEIYLLDDPFAAVDIHVAQHIFSNCIMGILRRKTRLLCTHQTQLLKHADVVIVLEEGRIIEAGPPSDILGSSILKRLQSVQSAQDSNTEDAEGGDGESVEDTHNDDNAADTLVEEEEQETGVVQFHVYQSYWKAVGVCLAPAVLLSLFLMQGSRNINDWWLSYWVSHSHHPKGNESHVGPHQDYGLLQFYSSNHLVSESTSNHTAWTNITSADDNVKFYLTVYGCLAVGNSLFTLLRAFLFAYGGICAAKIVHSDLLKSILQAPITFFDTTPIGRILNRFSSDVYAIDDTLPFVLNILLAQFYGLLGTVVITCYGLPWFLILLVPLGAVYLRIQSYYRKTSRELKRITSVTLSPIYAHFSESVTGLMTIRALRQKDRFIDENERRLDLNQRAQFSSTAAGQWFDISLQSIGVSMVTGVAFIAVLEHNFQTVDPGLVGLAISYALMITGLLNGVVTFFTETEKQMVSMERAKQYIEDVPCEKLEGMLHAAPFWPLQGVIEFSHVVLQYRPGLPSALNNVTFETKSAEKIGIVGRTGSGKSSLFLSLYRMVELTSGWIMIDGLNVSHLGLQDLRSRLAIIPQDPFLFSGTVRENLDPSQMYNDNELWGVLEKCHMRSPVERLGGLDAEVAERGKHFSLGQRQLICLARALLTRAKVLCMDEATASVDHETDQLIQRTIKTEFSNMTVLTIAHRINTVLESDRVLVMENGKVAEFAPPQMLLDNPNSMFSSLVRESAI